MARSFFTIVFFLFLGQVTFAQGFGGGLTKGISAEDYAVGFAEAPKQLR